MIIQIILIIIIGWIFFAIILPFLILPNQLFKTDLQRTKQIKKLAEKLKAKTREQTLRNIYKYVTKTYEGKEKKYKLANYPRLFLYNVNNLIKKRQFIACHIQNHVTKTLLINTSQFKESDIKRNWTITKFLTIHQYLVVKIKKAKYKVDPFFRTFVRKT